MMNNYKNRFARHISLWLLCVLTLLGSFQRVQATTCPNATVISPASLPIISQALTCGANDINSATVAASVLTGGCASTSYYGGDEALYTFTPATTGIYDISIAGQTWTSIFVFNDCPTTAGTVCVGGVTSSAASKNVTVTLTAGVTYYIMFDIFPLPQSPCPGTFSIQELVANTATATALGGLWNSPETWASGVVPNAASTVVIPAGSIVTVNQVTAIAALQIDGTLQWNATASAMTITGDLTINSTGRFLPYTTAAGGLTGVTVNIAGNFTNNGYANLAMGTSTSTVINFNGSGSTLSGTGTFEGDGTRGIIRALFFQNTGSNSISTTQPLTTYTFGHTAGSLNTNGLLRIDNTARIFGRPFNTQVASVHVTAMGSLYNAAPVVFGAAVTQWTNISGTLNTLYVSGNNVYRCVFAGSIGPNAPTHTSGIAQNLLWIGTTGTLGNPFLGSAAHVAGTQYFYGGNLYTCVTAGTADAANPPTHTSGIAGSGGAFFRYVGTPAQVSVNYDATTQTVRSLSLVNPGSGYSSSTAPTLVFSLGVAGGTGSGAAATAMIPYAIFGPVSSLTQKSGISTITGGLDINSDGGASTLSTDPQASSGVGAVYLTNGGVNYTNAPQVGFSGPTALNLVTNPGSGYTTAPTITVTGGTLVAGTALTSSSFTITVNQGKVVSVYLTGTGQYSVPPTLAFTGGGGSGATLEFPANCWPAATASIGSNGQILDITMTNSGYGYVAAPTVAVGTANGAAGSVGGTFTTVASGLTARAALYNLTLNFFTPAPSAVQQADADGIIPANRKLNNLSLSGNGRGLSLSNNLTLYGTAPLSLTASGNAPGNILDLNGYNLYCSWNGYAGATSTNGATAVYIKGGSMTLTTRGGGTTGSTLNFPFQGNAASGTFGVFTGTGTATTGADVLTVKVTELGAPSNSIGGSTGYAVGTRSFRVETATTLGAPAVCGTNPTVIMNYAANRDSLTTLQNQTFISEGASQIGAWTRRSNAVSANATALAATGTLTSATAAPGPVSGGANRFFSWSFNGAVITSVSPNTVCETSGALTINGQGFTGVTDVKIGGTPVTTFTIANDTVITAVAGAGTTGVVSVTKLGAEFFGTDVITLTPAPAAPSVSPASATLSAGQTVTFTASGTETTFNWYDAPVGGNLLFSGSDYIASPGCNTTTYYVAQNNGSCEGPRTAVTATVQLPAVSITPSSTSGCVNDPITLVATTANPNYIFTWSGNGTGTLNTNSGATVISTPTTAGNLTFIVNATDTTNGCINSSTIVISVTALPSAVASPATSTICAGQSVQLNTAFVGPFTGTIGTQTSVSGTFSYPAAYGPYYYGYRMQLMIRASELTVAGFAAGPIQSLGFPITTAAGQVLTGYTIKMANVSAADLSAEQTVSTVVFGPVNYTSAAGPNTHTLTNPFVWDGTSNLVIETCFNNTSYTTNSVGPLSATSYVSCRWFNADAAGVCASATVSTASLRPQVVLNATGTTFVPTPGITFSWSPTSGLSDPSINNPVANPTSTTTYTLTATSTATGCSAVSTAQVNVNQLPALPVANNGTHCGNQVPVCSVDTVVGAIAYRWYDSAAGGTLLQSGPSTTYTTPISVTTTFYVAAFDGNCEGPRVAVTETVIQPDAIDITSSTTSFCINSSYTLTVNTANPNYAFIWSGNGTGSLNVNTGGTVISTPISAGNLSFIVTATDASQGCITTDTLNVVVNTLPNATAAPASATICEGESTQLNVSGTLTATIGTQTSVSSTFSYPAAYGNYYWGHRQQIMVLASELSAAGFTAGPIFSLGFPINTPGGVPLTDFTIKMANVAVANLSTQQTVSTVVFGPVTYTDVAGLNTHTFTTPFVWDGTSNLVIETCFNNQSFTNNSQGPISTTPFVSCRWLNQDAAGVCAGTMSSTSSSRPVMVLNATSLASGVTFSWSPATGLNNANISNPLASPTTTTTYTVTVTNPATGCSTLSSSQINVNSAPAAPTANNSSQCGTAIPTASVNPVAGATAYFWFDAPTSGNQVQADPALTYLSPVSATTTFYVASFNGNCLSTTRTPVTVTVSTAPAILASADDSLLCEGTNTITLSETLGNYPTITWSVNAGGVLNSTSGSVVTASPSTAGTYTYTVTGTDGFCSNTDNVTVVVGAIPAAPSTINISNSSICQGGTATLTVPVSTGGGGGTLTYCPSGASSAADTKIEAVTLGTLSNSTAPTACETYTNYTATVPAPVLVPGQSYPASITHGSCSGTWYGGYSKMFIDFNQNGVFEDPAEFVLGGAHPVLNSIVSGNVSIPLTALPGNTRMRVVLDENGSAATGPCATFTWGETEDYTVFISGNLPGAQVVTYTWGPAGSVSPTTGTSTTFTGSTLGQNSVILTIADSATGCAVTINNIIQVSETAVAPTCANTSRCGQGDVTLTATAAGNGQLFWTENNSGNILGLGNSLTRTVTTGGTDYVREFPSNLDTTAIGYDPIGNPTVAAGYFPTTTQGMWFYVDNPQGVIIKSVDIFPNGPVGSNYAFAIVDTLGNTIGTASGVTTVTNTSTTPPLNGQTVDINIFVPFSTTPYALRPIANPNLAVHQNVTVQATAPWQITGNIRIQAYGNMPPTPSFFGTNTFGFFYNWQVMHGCFGPACAASYTVTPPPALNITAGGPTTFCATGGTNVVTLDAATNSDPSYVNFNWQPATGLNTTTGANVTATVSSTTTYIVTANDGVTGGCANSDTITITVNTAPFVSTGAVPDTICNSTVLQLNGSGGPASFKFVGTSQNLGATAGWPFNGANASQRMQVGVSAAELTAAGLTGPGFINSIGFQVANKLSTQPYTNFTVSVKAVPVGGACFFSNAYATFGPADVVFTGNVSTVLGWNDLVFQNPFFWNGTSDIIINTCFNNSTTSFFDIVFTTPTSACPTVLADNASACGVTTGTQGINRPNMRFQGGAVNYSWSPATELSNANIANPTFTGTGGVGPRTLVVTVTDPSNNCTASDSVNFYVSSTPASPSISFVGIDTTACLSGSVTLAATFIDGTIRWQESSDGVTFTDIAGATASTLTRTYSAPTYVRAKAFCADTSFSNVKFVQVFNPAIIATVGDTVCGQGNVTLSATSNPGYFIRWYADSTSSGFLANGGSYSTFVSQTDTFWVAALVDTLVGSGGDTLTTTFAGGNGASGNFFDVTVSSPINLTGMRINNNTAGAVCEVWYRPGTHVGNTGSNSGWTQIFNGPVATAQGFISGLNQALSIGTHGFFVFLPAGGITYTNGTNYGGVYSSDANIAILEGAGTGGTFGSGLFGPPTGTRIWNGSIIYSVPNCVSPRVPVIAKVNAAPAVTVTPDATTICEGASVTLNLTAGAGDYTDFTWSPATGLSSTSGTSVVANPTVSTSYIVTASGNPNGCVNSDTAVITVNPAPVFTLSSSSNSVCGGGTVTVTANVTAPVGGTYTVSSIPHSPVTPPASPSAGPTGDDSQLAGIALPFPFVFNGTAQNSVNIYTNGFIQFGATSNSTTSYGAIIPTAGAPNNIVALAWEDLNATTGNIQYWTSGTAPNRKFVVAYNNVFYWSASGNVTGQIVLNEGTNTIDIFLTNINQAGSNSSVCGIENATGTYGLVAPGRQFGAWGSGIVTNEGWRFAPVPAASISWSGPNIQGASNTAAITAQPSNSSYYVATVSNPLTGCIKVDSILINASANPTPRITTNDTTLCNPAQIYVKVADIGAYSAGYPVGTTFTWKDATGATYFSATDVDSISSTSGSSFYVDVILPSGCFGRSDTSFVLTKAVSVTSNAVNATCVGPNGSINVEVVVNAFNGVAPPYRFVWSTDAAQTNIVQDVTKTSTQDTLSGLAAGNYFLQVFDAAGSPASCNSGVVPFTITSPPPIVVSGTATDVTCNGLNDGAISISWTGGSAPYTLAWSDNVTSSQSGTTASRSSLAGGTYTVTVSDGQGCAGNATVVVNEPSPVTVTLSSTNASSSVAADGSVAAVASGGTGPYTYDWADSNLDLVGSGSSVSGLPAGLYYCQVTDITGCGNDLFSDTVRVYYNVNMSVTMLFEGFYDGAGTMKPVLFNAFVAGAGLTETDSVVLQLRDPIDYSVLFSTTTVVSTSGLATAILSSEFAGSSAYIAVKHRNAVQTWSAAPVSITGTGVSYNFTTAATQAFGDNQISLGAFFGFFSGDVNQDDVVDVLDQIDVDNDASNLGGGYVSTDLDGDGVVDILDQIILDNNAVNFVGAFYPVP